MSSDAASNAASDVFECLAEYQFSSSDLLSVDDAVARALLASPDSARTRRNRRIKAGPMAMDPTYFSPEVAEAVSLVVKTSLKEKSLDCLVSLGRDTQVFIWQKYGDKLSQFSAPAFAWWVSRLLAGYHKLNACPKGLFQPIVCCCTQTLE